MSITLTPENIRAIWGRNRNADAPVQFDKVSPIRAAIAAGTYAEPVMAGEPLARIAADVGRPDLAAYIRDGIARAERAEEEPERWDGLS